MTPKPISDAPKNQDRISITVNGRRIEAGSGDNLSAVLWANGYLSFGRDPFTGAERSVYCGIGHCGQCLVTVDGIEDQRACRLNVRDGMRVEFPVSYSTADGNHEH